MPWITPSLSDLNDARAGALVTALRTKALADGQTDPVPRLIQNVVDEVRRCIAFCPRTPLDVDAAKIPLGLKELAVQKVIRTAKGRLLQALSEDERAAETLYQKRLEQLTRCEWPVDLPDTPAASPTVETGGGSQIVSTPSRVTASDLRGL